jgi:hypothetical protein
MGRSKKKDPKLPTHSNKETIMGLRKITTFILFGTLAIVAVLGAFTYRAVSAQAPTPTAPAQSDTEKGTTARPMMGKRGGYTQEELAAALGIDVETLQAAYQTATKAALDQAVSQGIITQEQADQYLANGVDGRHAGKLGMLKFSEIDYQALLADALGVSVDELKAAQQKAFTTAIDNAVTAGTLTQEQADLMKGQQALFSSDKFQTSMKTAFEAAVKQAVTDGLITQAQADQILANQSGSFGFGGRGFGDHGFGRHGRNGGFPPASPDSPSGEPPSTGTGGDL